MLTADLSHHLRGLIAQTPPNSLDAAILFNNLAVALQEAGSFQEADDAYKQSLVYWEALEGSNHQWIAQSLSNRASLYRDMQVYAEAERVFQLAVRIWNEHGWPQPGAMQPLDQCVDIKGQAAWSELPQRDRLPLYGQKLQDLRNAVIEEERNGIDGPARAAVQIIIEKLGPWFHNVLLTGTIGTCPENPGHPANRWEIIEPFVPQDLSGKTILDIGCNSGFFSLELKRRGADRVLGIDIMPHILAQSRFTSHWFGLPIELLERDVYDVDTLGRFDIVIFLGVLYHLQHPLLALQKIEKACSGTLFCQTAIRGGTDDFEPADDYPMAETEVFEESGYPKLYFIEKCFNGDESNWWMATQSCLKAMLRTSGFATVQETAGPDIFVCRKQTAGIDRAPSQTATSHTPFSSGSNNPYFQLSKESGVHPPALPGPMKSGSGSHIVDVNGTDYVDFDCANGTNLLGYGYRKVARAVSRQAGKFNGLGLPAAQTNELTSLLRKLIPTAEEVRFGHNESDVCAGAVRLARFITGREKILYRGVHGLQDWYLASTDCPGIPAALKRTVKAQPDLSPAAVDAVFRQYRGQIAGIILSPLTQPIPTADQIRETIEVIHNHGGIVIFDETASGFRIAPGGMQEVWRVRPDLSCFGPAMANGLPLSALCGNGAYIRRLPEISYGMSLEGDAVSIAAALATLTEMMDKKVVPALYEKGRRIRAEYQRLAERHKIETSLLGYEPTMRMEFQPQAGISGSELRSIMIQALISNRIFTRGDLTFCYSHGRSELQKLEKALDSSMSVVSRKLSVAA